MGLIMARYCRERQIHPRAFAKGSLRTITRGGRGVKQVVGCQKGKYSKKRGKCKVGMRVQTILYPEGSDPRCGAGEGGKELSRAKRHKKNPHLTSGKWKFVGMFDKGDMGKVRRLLKVSGIKLKITKDHENGDPRKRELYVGRNSYNDANVLIRGYFFVTKKAA